MRVQWHRQAGPQRCSCHIPIKGLSHSAACRIEAEESYERVRVPSEGDHGSWRSFCFGDKAASSPPQQPTMLVLMAIDQVGHAQLVARGGGRSMRCSLRQRGPQPLGNMPLQIIGCLAFTFGAAHLKAMDDIMLAGAAPHR